MNIKYYIKKGFKRRQYKRFIPTVFLSLFLIFTVTLLTGLTKYRQFVTIVDEKSTGNEVKALSFLGDDVNSILKQENIRLGKNDVLSFKKRSGKIDINIKRACKIYFTFAGKNPEVLSFKAGTNLKDILKIKNICYDPSKHQLNHSLEYIPTNGDNIIVNEISTMKRDSTAKQTEIGFSVKEVSDPNIKKGERVITEKGEVGILEQYDQDEISNGVIVRTNSVSNIVKPPKEEVVHVGTKEEVAPPKVSDIKHLDVNKLQPGIKIDSAKKSVNRRHKNLHLAIPPINQSLPSSPDGEGWQTIKGDATAYTFNVGKRTATGKAVGVGDMAVDPKKIPFGSQVEVLDKAGKVIARGTANDTGGALKSGRAAVDVFLPTSPQCRAFGRKKNITVRFKAPPQAHSQPKPTLRNRKR